MYFNELNNWLKSCKYPRNVIHRAFNNATLQGSAHLRTNANNIPFVKTYDDSVNVSKKAKNIRKRLSGIQSDQKCT